MGVDNFLSFADSLSASFSLCFSFFFNRFSCKILHLDTSRTTRHRPTRRYPQLVSFGLLFTFRYILFSQIRINATNTVYAYICDREVKGIQRKVRVPISCTIRVQYNAYTFHHSWKLHHRNSLVFGCIFWKFNVTCSNPFGIHAFFDNYIVLNIQKQWRKKQAQKEK